MNPIAAFALGFGGWWLFKRVNRGLGGGNEPKVYDRLFDLTATLKKATARYQKLVQDVSDMDMRIEVAGSGLATDDVSAKLRVMRKIDGIRVKRNALALEAAVLMRTVIVPVRQKIVTEDARLKSAVIAPRIALERSGNIPLSGTDKYGTEDPPEYEPSPVVTHVIQLTKTPPAVPLYDPMSNVRRSAKAYELQKAAAVKIERDATAARNAYILGQKVFADRKAERDAAFAQAKSDPRRFTNLFKLKEKRLAQAKKPLPDLKKAYTQKRQLVPVAHRELEKKERQVEALFAPIAKKYGESSAAFEKRYKKQQWHDVFKAAALAIEKEGSVAFEQ